MFGITDLISFIVAAGLVILVPGPSFLYVVGQAGARGIKEGVAAGLGVATGDSILMVLSIIGVASLFKAFPSALVLVKYLGASYLVYLGITSLFARPVKAKKSEKKYPKEAAPFKRGLLITVLNPKGILFFMAFFPLFIDPGYEYKALTFIVLVGIFHAMSLLYLGVGILASRHMRNMIDSQQKAKNVLKKLSGTLFIGFGIKLASG